MTKKEVASKLRRGLTMAIRSLPDDVEYRSVSRFEDFTTQMERDYESKPCGLVNSNGALHIIEFDIEEVRDEMVGGAE